MSIQIAYEAYLEKRKALNEDAFQRNIWTNQESRYVKPFQIYGNVYYVGDSWVCVHLVDTGDGLLLIDAGNCGATAMLIQAIWETGFHPADVKWMILSHGHLDHIGGANFMRTMFGTKLYLGEPDAIMFKERPALSAIQDSPNFTDSLFVPDVVIRDGDVMTFGNTMIRFYLVPGHTAGCIACFFDVTDGHTVRRAGYYGGFGFNTLQREYLIESGDPEFKTRIVYLDSLKKVRDERVEIFLGNHTSNNNLMQKRVYMLEHPNENPFVDEQEWKGYLDGKRDEMRALIDDETM